MSLDDGHDSDGAEDGATVSRGAGGVKGPVWGPMFGQVCFVLVFGFRQGVELTFV